MVRGYSHGWHSMANDDSLMFMRRGLELDEKNIQLRSRCLPVMKEALPGRKAAAFFQLDERIGMMIDLEFAPQLPLLHGARWQDASGPALQ